MPWRCPPSLPAVYRGRAPTKSQTLVDPHDALDSRTCVKVLQTVVTGWMGEWRDAARVEAACEAAMRRQREEGREYTRALLLLWRERQ